MTETFRLTNLKLKRVSLVSEPAQEPASVVLFKSRDAKKTVETTKDDGGSDVMCGKCNKAAAAGTVNCPSCGSKLPAGAKKMKSPIDLDKIEDPETRKAVEKMAADLKAAEELAQAEQDKRIAAEKKAPAPAKTDDGDVLKGLTPEARTLVEKAQSDAAKAIAEAKVATDAIKKMADERREAEFVSKAKAFGNLSIDAKTFGVVLKRVADGVSTEADVAEIERILAGANAIAKKALFTQKGSGNRTENGGSAIDQITAKAKELREEVVKSGEKLSMPDAIDRVIRQNPELYTEYVQSNQPVAVNGGSQEEE